jgi:hypothetical protein
VGGRPCPNLYKRKLATKLTDSVTNKIANFSAQNYAIGVKTASVDREIISLRVYAFLVEISKENMKD